MGLDTVTTVMSMEGYGQYIPLLLSVVGLFSAVSVFYPPAWPGAKLIHTIALLKGNARPAVPAGTANGGN